MRSENGPSPSWKISPFRIITILLRTIRLWKGWIRALRRLKRFRGRYFCYYICRALWQGRIPRKRSLQGRLMSCFRKMTILDPGPWVKKLNSMPKSHINTRTWLGLIRDMTGRWSPSIRLRMGARSGTPWERDDWILESRLKKGR